MANKIKKERPTQPDHGEHNRVGDLTQVPGVARDHQIPFRMDEDDCVWSLEQRRESAYGEARGFLIIATATAARLDLGGFDRFRWT